MGLLLHNVSAHAFNYSFQSPSVEIRLELLQVRQ
jgi:hypothetical protein